MNDPSTKRAVLFIATLSSFVTPFMAAATNLALPAIQKDFSMDAILLAWIPTSYLLSTAVFLLPFGKLADIRGRKKIYVWGITVFSVASLLAAISQTAWMLILSRVIQGLGSAMIFSTGMAMLTSVFPITERGRAIGITVAAVYIGLSIGPWAGGLLTQFFTWRSIFAVTVPFGILTIYLCFTRLKGEWADAKGEKLDLVGSVLFGAGIMLVMYGFSTLPSVESIWEILGGLLLIGLFVAWELRTPSPVFNLELFRRNRAFAFSSLAALINYGATFAVTFVLSLYLQYIKDLAPQTAGLVIMAQPIMMAVFSPFAGRLSDRIEPQKVASLGMALTAAGLLALSFLNSETKIVFIVLNLLLLGFGFALFSSPNMNAIMSSVEKRFYGIASGTVAAMRLLGQMLSMGMATLVFSLYIGRVEITPDNYPLFLTSVGILFQVSSILCVLGVFASLARGKIRPDRPE